MSLWNRYLSVESIIGIASILTAIAIALIPPIRGWVGDAGAYLLTRAGYARRRYRKWFLGQYSFTYNLYLDKMERLGLAETFVPLSVAVMSRGAPTRRAASTTSLVATDVMAEAGTHRLIILGDAGAGKSTLLKAYAVSLFGRKSGQGLPRTQREVPVIVPLRHLAQGLEEYGTLERYIFMQILASDANLGRMGPAFLSMLIRRRRLLLLLDGIDEVSNANYSGALRAIHNFAQEHSTRVRIVITCRQQNFRARRGDWIPSFADHAYVLAEFRDEDIRAYVNRRAKDFIAPHSAASFITDVFEAGLADLHRVPLVLAMSVGLYASRPDFEIPPTVSLLYEAMVEDLLERRDNRISPGASTNAFSAMDKHVFLAKFAFRTAADADRFDDFARSAMVAAAQSDAPSLSAVQASAIDAFIDEIVNRSGLLVPVTDEGDLTFAHRSVYEYLAADYLRRSHKNPTRFLLDHAVNPQWRQPILFFSAMCEGDIDSFLLALAGLNLDLAGYCLGVSPLGSNAAETIIGRLARASRSDAGLMLPSLLFAARSPSARTRALAAQAFRDAVVQLGQAGMRASDFGGDEEGLTRILTSVATSGSEAIVSSAAPMLGDLLPDSPQLVSLLWRCLDTAEIERTSGARYLTKRLLSMARDPRLFELLQALPHIAKPAFEPEVRKLAYPFRRGQDLHSNLVTLIAMGDKLRPQVEVSNMFYEAKRSPGYFKTIERSKRFTITVPSALFLVPVQLFISAVAFGLVGWGWFSTLAKIYSVGTMRSGLVAIEEAVGLGPFGYAVLLFPVLLVGIFIVIGIMISDDGMGTAALITGASSPVLTIIMVPLGNVSLWAYFFSVPIAAAVGALTGVFCIGVSRMIVRIMDGYKLLHFPPLNPYLGLYEDPGSRHWVMAGI